MKDNGQTRIGVLQRVLPSYRVTLFDALAEANNGNVSIFAGEARKSEALKHGALPMRAELWKGKNIHLFSGPFYLCWQIGLLRWLDESQPDVLIMEANPRYLRSIAAIRRMRRNGGKVIGWGLGAPALKDGLVELRTAVRKRFIHHFDALITYSAQGGREYRSLGFPKERIYIAPNAVAPSPTHPMPNRALKFRGGHPVIVFVGRLQERKRVDTLIRACAELPPGQQPLLWVIGDGPQCTRLKTLAAEIYPLAEFLGAQHGTDLENYLRLADLFVLPGTGGLAVQEAMSFGLPVIVGVADGTQTDLVRNENGWMLKDDSIEALRDTIKGALSDIKSLRIKGKASYQIVSREINLENMVSIFNKAIREVIEG